MKRIAFILPVIILLAGCMTADKATGYLSAHRETAAGYCAAQFPVKETSQSFERIDTAGYNQTVTELLVYGDSVTNAAAQKNDSIASLRAKIEQMGRAGLLTKSTVEVLQAQLNGIKPTDTEALKRSIRAELLRQIKPCKDSLIIKTVENTARYEEQKAKADRLQLEKDQQQKWKDIWFKVAMIELALILIYIFGRIYQSKLGSVARFIK